MAVAAQAAAALARALREEGREERTEAATQAGAAAQCAQAGAGAALISITPTMAPSIREEGLRTGAGHSTMHCKSSFALQS